MLLDFKLRQRKKIIGFTIPCLLLLGAAAWYFLAEPPFEQEVAKINPTIQVAPTTKVAQTVFYEKCKDTEKYEIPVKENEIGLDYVQFQALYPQWNIELFHAAQIAMSLLDPGFCPEHRAHQYIGIQGDYVAVFCGTPTKKPVLKELTQIKTAALHPQALEEVKKGLAFQSHAEMLRILEGLHSK